MKLLAPREFRDQQVGETVVTEPQKAMGRVVEVNLFELTRDPRKQSVRLYLEVKEIKNDNAYTEVKKYKVLDTHLKRLVKAGKSKVMEYFDAKAKDQKIRVKVFMLTKNKTTNSVCTALRKGVRTYLEKYLKEKTVANFVSDLTAGNLQRVIKTDLKKIYPVVVVEVSSLEVLK